MTKYYPGDFIGALDDFNRVIDSWYSGRKSKSKAYFRRGLVKIDMGDKECACADPGRSVKMGYVKASDVWKVICE